MTKREAELELQVWQERAAHVQTKGVALQAQTQLIQIEFKQCGEEIARLQGIVNDLTEQEKASAAQVAEQQPQVAAAAG